LNSPLEESLINFFRSGPHLLNETTGEPVANEATIWKSGKQYVRVESKSGTSLAKNKRQREAPGRRAFAMHATRFNVLRSSVETNQRLPRSSRQSYLLQRQQ
jgi:hypothetical protein